MKTALSQDKFAALRLAELRMTDQEDFESCVADMQRTASLNNDEAVEVAKAIRAKHLPVLAREAGFDEDVVSSFVDLEDGQNELVEMLEKDSLHTHRSRVMIAVAAMRGLFACVDQTMAEVMIVASKKLAKSRKNK